MSPVKASWGIFGTMLWERSKSWSWASPRNGRPSNEVILLWARSLQFKFHVLWGCSIYGRYSPLLGEFKLNGATALEGPMSIFQLLNRENEVVKRAVHYPEATCGCDIIRITKGVTKRYPAQLITNSSISRVQSVGISIYLLIFSGATQCLHWQLNLK